MTQNLKGLEMPHIDIYIHACAMMRPSPPARLAPSYFERIGEIRRAAVFVGKTLPPKQQSTDILLKSMRRIISAIYSKCRCCSMLLCILVFTTKW